MRLAALAHLAVGLPLRLRVPAFDSLELDCDHPSLAETNLDPCSTHGRCVATGRDTRRCACAKGWRGSRCEQATCVRDCGAHGRCDVDARGTTLNCICALGWGGARCRKRECPVSEMTGAVCFGHGACQNAAAAAVAGGASGSICFCAAGWLGVDCAKRICPVANGLPCSGRGLCLDLYFIPRI